MINRLSAKIVGVICTEEYNNSLDKAKMQYGLNIILCEGLKLIALFALFGLMGRLDYFTLSLIILISIRTFSGGVHVRGNLNCLFVSALLFICTCAAAPMLMRGSSIYYAAAAAISIIPLVLNAPVCSVTRPIRSIRKRRQFKAASIGFSILWIALLTFLFTDSYSRCGLTTIILQNIQLLFVKEELK